MTDHQLAGGALQSILLHLIIGSCRGLHSWPVGLGGWSSTAHISGISLLRRSRSSSNLNVKKCASHRNRRRGRRAARCSPITCYLFKALLSFVCFLLLQRHSMRAFRRHHNLDGLGHRAALLEPNNAGLNRSPFARMLARRADDPLGRQELRWLSETKAVLGFRA